MTTHPISPPPAALAPIGKGEKTAFTLGSVGKNILFWGIGTFLLVFYTDVFGLTPTAVGTLFLVARLLDAVNDPIVGYILDHLKPTRWGRFRPWLLLGGVLAGLNFAALFLGPELSYTGKLLYAYVTYLVFGITFDLVDIPYSSLMVTMTQNTHERNKLNSLVAIGLIIGTGLAVVGTVPLVGLFPTPQQGYRAGRVAAGIRDAAGAAHGVGLAGAQLGKAKHPARRGAVGGAGVNHFDGAASGLLYVADHGHGVARGVVVQTQHHHIDLGYQGALGGGVFALLGRNADQLHLRHALQAFANL